MRLGLFGGSFDPVHNGHLLLAECCRDQARLDEVWFIPAGVQPLKAQGPVASNADRVLMLRLAIAGRERLVVSTIEVDRGGVSYTVDTLRAVRGEHPDDELFFLMGADTLADLPQWREPAEVLRLATPLVVHRAGQPPADFAALEGLVTSRRIQSIRQLLVEMPPTDIRSSDIRRRLAQGEAIDGMTPPEVVAHARSVYNDR
jgi:nicotinate-nucleotide adenylyltransferase